MAKERIDLKAKNEKLIREWRILHWAYMRGQWPVQWLGVRIEKPTEDLFVYADIIFQNMPDFLIEIGTRWGGSALWFACIMDIVQHGQVISVDINPHIVKRHPRVRYVKGDALDPYVYQFIEDRVGDGTCMVSEDSSHKKDATLKIMGLYGGLVTPGQYMVVEDIVEPGGPALAGPTPNPCPHEAVEEFVKGDDKWEWDHSVEKFLFTWMAWLRKK